MLCVGITMDKLPRQGSAFWEIPSEQEDHGKVREKMRPVRKEVATVGENDTLELISYKIVI